jgi:hypothetical protein
MKKLKILTFFSTLMMLAVVGCNQPYYHIPTDANGDPDITDISTTTVSPDPVTTDDSKFTITAHLPNAHEGDKMTVKVLKKQEPSGGGSKQMLRIGGVEKQVDVNSDLNASVSFTTQKAELNDAGDEVLVVFEGDHDSAQMKITMKSP